MRVMPLDDIALTTIDGRDERLTDHRGEVLLVVNTASKCGLTKQYEGLERLYRRYREQGFRVLGFPSNDFLGQEPGSEAEIASFCSTEYDVTFPLYAKGPVNGPDRQPLYRALIAAEPHATSRPGSDFTARVARHLPADRDPSDVTWNFEKFLVGRDGEVVGRFAPDVEPEDDLLVRAIERELQPGADV